MQKRTLWQGRGASSKVASSGRSRPTTSAGLVGKITPSTCVIGARAVEVSVLATANRGLLCAVGFSRCSVGQAAGSRGLRGALSEFASELTHRMVRVLSYIRGNSDKFDTCSGR
jgi:hypothetical protein